MTLSLASRRFLHDNHDEDDSHSPEHGGTPEGPVPIVEGVGKATADDVTQAAESKAVPINFYVHLKYLAKEP